MVGHSEFSRIKWERLEYLMTVHVRMVKLITEKNLRVDPRYHYVDLYAGPGLYGVQHDAKLAGEVGSPIRAIRCLRREAVQFTTTFSEPEHGEELVASLVAEGFEDADRLVWRCECSEAVARLTRYRTRRVFYGLVFVDPNGYPDWSAVKTLSTDPDWRCIDFLINLHAAVHKWCFVSSAHDETMRPTEHLRSLGKKAIYLWRPHPSNPHQFTLAYCTNGPFPEFRRLGFHNINSDEGRALVRLIDYPTKERATLGPLPGMLPFME